MERKFNQLISKLRDSDIPVRIVWEENGPIQTAIQTHGVADVGQKLVYFQNFTDGGFDYFIATEWNDLIECENELRELAKQ